MIDIYHLHRICTKHLVKYLTQWICIESNFRQVAQWIRKNEKNTKTVYLTTFAMCTSCSFSQFTDFNNVEKVGL